ncbi:M20 metallopeptidase family protein [Streptacidiphilus fuscans]|uniref:Amidohydrolase n=1 Tax=Streptacidiphilus fuscans TaxID=2789292 RepID=A0A931FF12_9ACTN|nr:M20 family metallopeptidase [Streptacidiphilus fuscans]MBF9069291.1 amidohydrolase [Streptacidiphilus fuscans]
MGLLDDARAMAPELVALRRAVHQEPEVGLYLPRTQERILEGLEGVPGTTVTTGRALSSVTAVLRGSRPGPTVLLRADMDALPLTERADVPYRSRDDSAMHACGHDLHTAMLVGAAHLLAARADRMAGQVVLMFQPGEEGGDGARLMLDEGVLEAGQAAVPVDGPETSRSLPVAAYALHVSSRHWARGQFATRPGAVMAASDRLVVTVHGTGGHGSAPHHARNPIPAACAMVGELSGVMVRSLDPMEPVTFSVGAIHAGTAANIIPETASFQATVRTFSQDAGDRLAAAVTTLCRGVAEAHGVTAEVRYLREYPPTIATPAESAFAADVARELFGEERYEEMRQPLTAAEDFSRVLARVPGTVVQLGATPEGQDHRSAPGNHSPHVVFDDSLVADGAALYAGLALQRLSEHGN